MMMFAMRICPLEVEPLAWPEIFMRMCPDQMHSTLCHAIRSRQKCMAHFCYAFWSRTTTHKRTETHITPAVSLLGIVLAQNAFLHPTFTETKIGYFDTSVIVYINHIAFYLYKHLLHCLLDYFLQSSVACFQHGMP